MRKDYLGQPFHTETEIGRNFSTFSPKANAVILGQVLNPAEFSALVKSVQVRVFHLTEVIPGHSLNAALPIYVTDSGMDISEICVMPEQRYAGIFSTFSPKVNEVMLGQVLN